MITNILNLVKISFVLSFILFYAFFGQFIPGIAMIYYGCELTNSTGILMNFIGYGLIGLSLPVMIVCHALPFVLCKD